MSRISTSNVPGCPGWHYGLLVGRRDERDRLVCRFDVFNSATGQRIENLTAVLGEHHAVAQRAICELSN